MVLGEGDGQETLTAHDIFLRRAEYFETALKIAFQEGRARRVELPEVCPKLMEELVRVFYCDNFDRLAWARWPGIGDDVIVVDGSSSPLGKTSKIVQDYPQAYPNTSYSSSRAWSRARPSIGFRSMG